MRRDVQQKYTSSSQNFYPQSYSNIHSHSDRNSHYFFPRYQLPFPNTSRNPKKQLKAFKKLFMNLLIMLSQLFGVFRGFFSTLYRRSFLTSVERPQTKP